jgi:hypothetical protein
VDSKPIAVERSIIVLGPLALVLSLGSCHFEDSETGCSALIDRLYEARTAGDTDLIREILKSQQSTEQEQEALERQIGDRDAACGKPRSRTRNMSRAKYGGVLTGYSVRDRYAIEYASGSTWEIVVCHADSSGRQPSIVGIEFGPVPVK